MNYTYEATYEDESPDGTVRVSAEIRITYTVNWGCSARVHYDENDHPAEPDKLEIHRFEIEDVSYPSGKLTWRKSSQMENDTLESWADSEYLRELMLEEAREIDKGGE